MDDETYIDATVTLFRSHHGCPQTNRGQVLVTLLLSTNAKPWLNKLSSH